MLGGGSSNKRGREAANGVYSLLEALEGVMAAPSYLDALLALAKNSADKPRRRALQLFSEKVSSVAEEADDGAAMDPAACSAAVQLCPLLPALLGQTGVHTHLDHALLSCGLLYVFKNEQKRSLVAHASSIIVLPTKTHTIW